MVTAVLALTLAGSSITAMASGGQHIDGVGTSVGAQEDMTGSLESLKGSTSFMVKDNSDTIPTYQIRVTVPLTAAFGVAKDGTTTVPSNYKIQNFSFYDVSVSGVEVTVGDWTLVKNPTEAKEVNMDYVLPGDEHFSLAGAVGAEVETNWVIGNGKVTQDNPSGATVFPIGLTAKAAKDKNTGSAEAANAYSVAYTVKILGTQTN